jgi:hypothetical protein
MIEFSKLTILRCARVLKQIRKGKSCVSYLVAANKYGFVVRKAALKEKSVGRCKLFQAMTDVDVLGEDRNIMSYGPLFEQEAFDCITSRLEGLDLIYSDDFCTFDFTMLNGSELESQIVR